ncbi:MAG TPA: class I SAM-dependent methyltransferase [Syntrophorhabdaceae bacterium]|nr:class I SAM-dependent methyltransferase [Syntrophorhabdaceae bacterium]
MASDIYKSYSNYPLHAKIGKIISAHSQNTRDVRDVVKNEIPWDTIQSMADLGCGYGWFEQGLTSSFDLIVGVDCLAENGPPFIESAKTHSENVLFKRVDLPAVLEFPSGSFDLVVCAYSLYFFPEALPEIERLLQEDGVFVAITHSNRMLQEGEEYFDFKNLKKIVERFSAENGVAILGRYFRRITEIDYKNSLIFRKGEEQDLAQYIDFKGELIAQDVDPDRVKTTMIEELATKGEVRLNKDDRIFLARK